MYQFVRFGFGTLLQYGIQSIVSKEALRTFSSSVTTSPVDGRVLYNPSYLMKKSEEYFQQKDIGQSCEKAFRAVELSLMDYVSDLESLFNVKIVPDNESWNRFMLDKLVTIIAKNYLSGDAKKLFRSGWDTAKIFHIEGWKLNYLTVDYVEDRKPDVEAFIKAVNSLPKKQEVAELLNEKLFVINTTKIVSRLKENIRTMLTADDSKKDKIVIEATQMLRLKTTLRNEQKLVISANITSDEKASLKKILGPLVELVFSA